MRKICLISSALAVWCSNVHGQTNCSIPPVELFNLPPPNLRSTAAPPESKTVPSKAGEDGGPAAQKRASESVSPGAQHASSRMSLSSDGNDFDEELYVRLVRGGLFTKHEAPTGFAKCLDSVFRPEVIHLGKTEVSCSIITAIKRKNPLCLLNPMVFNFNW